MDDPPYPVDDAAVHHVFPGGWIWVLRFNNGITSAGVAHSHADALRLSEGAAAWERLLAALPRVKAQFRNARAVIPFVYSPRLAFRSAVVTGPRWALLPSAAGVIDPLLSTGFPLNLLGLHRLLECLEKDGRARDEALLEYSKQTTDELDATERLVGALYATMHDYDLFKRMSLLYFAAASFTETVRRLGRPEKARGFLLHADPRFGPALRACCEAAVRTPSGDERRALLARIDKAIEPFDVAGLLDRSRNDRYPVLAEDLLAAAPKLGAGQRRCAACSRGGIRFAPQPVDEVPGPCSRAWKIARAPHRPRGRSSSQRVELDAPRSPQEGLEVRRPEQYVPHIGVIGFLVRAQEPAAATHDRPAQSRGSVVEHDEIDMAGTEGRLESHRQVERRFESVPCARESPAIEQHSHVDVALAVMLGPRRGSRRDRARRPRGSVAPGTHGSTDR